MTKFNKLLLSELRVIEGERKPKNTDVALSRAIQMALADGENLKALGYKLTGDSLINLAKDYSRNSSLKPVYQRVMEMEPSIEVSPMYPNFPIQVLNMSEEEFRTDQLLHYLTTYGFEEVTGEDVKKGWLPETKEIDERVEDVQLGELKTLEYLFKEEVDEKVIKDLMGRQERLLPKELELAKTVMLRTNLTIEEIPFKENIGAIFGDTLLSGDLQAVYKAFDSLRDVVKHPGDVLDVLEYVVVKNKYKHLKTSVKRGFVELIESFPISSIEENLASNRWSRRFLGKGGKARSINRNIALIDYLSYNRFSSNPSARSVVVDLKSGNLLSWNQKLEKAYQEKDYDKVLTLLEQRPGVLFRQVNRMVNVGVEPKKIECSLNKHAGKLKTQSIVSALNNYTGSDDVKKIFTNALIHNLAKKDLSGLFKDKKVYIDEKDVDLMKSRIEITDKFEEGGYIGNGIAIRIPENTEFLRFFTYWNDSKRIDIDLHGVSINKKGEKSHIGWYSRFKGESLVHSGDITHSDAAEYIDLDLKKAEAERIQRVQFNINSYTGVPFNKIETVFTGLMALSEIGQKADLFNPKNVIFRHDLTNKGMAVDYGVIDLKEKLMYISGKVSTKHNDTSLINLKDPTLSMKAYIGLLALTQEATIVDNKDEADLILGLAKSDEDNYISLIDENFFMDEE